MKGNIFFPINVIDDMERRAQKMFTGFDDIFKTFEVTTKLLDDYPSYPVLNHSFEEDGTEVMEIACTGFTKEEVKLAFEGNKIYINAHKEKKDEDKRKIKYLCKRLTFKDINLVYAVNKFGDMDKIKAEFKDCVLTLTIPPKQKGEETANRKNIEIS